MAFSPSQRLFFRAFLFSTLLSVSVSCSSVSPVALQVPNGVRALANPTAPAAPEAPPIRLKIKQADIEISSAELNKQFQSILALSNEKRLKETVLSTPPGNSLVAKGKLAMPEFLPDIPFQITGSLSVRPGNVIRYEATDIRVVGIPVKGLLDVFGVELSNLAKFKDRFGRIEQQGNAFHLIVEKFTKDAIIEGQMTRISSTGNGLNVIF
ncbi:MAG: hypothetical protein AB7I41_22625 [Candidatus Sericytochromatia bacterium]